MFNEIDGSYDDVAISTFKAGLPAEHELRKSLTGKPVASVRLLMDRIDKYRRIEEDQLQGKGKRRRSFRRGGILGRIGYRTIDLGETFQGNLHLPTPRQSMLYFGNQCKKS